MTGALVLAHQGGWDEILLVAGPILLFVVLLRRANRRAEEQSHGPGRGPADPERETGA